MEGVIQRASERAIERFIDRATERTHAFSNLILRLVGQSKPNTTLGTDKALDRNVTRSKETKGKTEDQIEAEKSAASLKMTVKNMSHDEQIQWYRSAKRKREAEVIGSKRTFTDFQCNYESI